MQARAIIGCIALSLIALCTPAQEPGMDQPNPAVIANADFTFDLYARLAAENAGKNLFFSPYSISGALAMVAEGARGETASQMARVLRFPEALRPLGNEAMEWKLSPIHAGFASLNERFNGGDKPALAPLRARIQVMRKQLDEANAQARQLQQAQMWDKAEEVARKAHELADQLNQLLPQVDQYELRVANALWGEKTYPFDAKYVDTMRRFYKTGGIFPVDFRNDLKGSVDQINLWVENQTNRRIKDLISKDAIPESQRPLISLILTNAIYFKGEWSEIFPADQTKEDDFLLADGGKARVPMMHHPRMEGTRYGAFNADGTFFATPREISFRESDRRENTLYPVDDGFAVLELPYKGGDLSMVVILPRSAGGLAAIERKLSSSNVQAWLSKAEKRTADVFMPRYRLETTYEMKQTLQAMGMTRAFNAPVGPDGAQFPGMCASQDPALQLYISQVVHKAFIEVTEKGTEAAAATAIMMAAGSAMPVMAPFTPTFRADKPFVFIIRDVKTGAILFAGRVANPA